jgi:hypothetical protein
MNKAKYDSLPADLKAVIDANSGFHASAWAGRAHDTGDADGKQVMTDAGNEIATMSEDLSTEIADLGAEVTADWIVEMTAKGLDGAGLVSDARAAVQVTRSAN